MRCANCGTFIRPGDRFCSSCGEPIETVDTFEEDLFEDSSAYTTEYDSEEPSEKSVNDRSGDRRTQREKPLYNEHVFRDSFLDETEEGHHAFLVTMTVLLVIATVTVGGLFLYTYMRQRGSSGRTPAQQESTAAVQQEGSGGEADDIVILSDGQNIAVSQDGGTATDSQVSDASGTVEGGSQDGVQADQQGAPQGENQEAQQTDTSSDAQSGQQTEAPAAAAEAAALDTARIEQIMAEEASADRYGISIYDLNTDQVWNIGESAEQMYASATITIPILYTAAQRLDQGAVTLNDQITYVNSIGGRGEPFPSQRDGYAYPLSYYLTTMLTYSDNNCINCLIDFFGLSNINSTCQNAGFTSVDLQRKIVADVTDGTENYISAQDLTQMVKELYNGKFTTIGRDFMLQNFKITTDDAYYTLIGQSDGLPDTVTLLNQNGRGDTRYAETAVILDDTHAYIISVMCTGEYGYLYEDAFRHVSDYVYETL